MTPGDSACLDNFPGNERGNVFPELAAKFRRRTMRVFGISVGDNLSRNRGIHGGRIGLPEQDRTILTVVIAIGVPSVPERPCGDEAHKSIAPLTVLIAGRRAFRIST